jgi:hypothetical protein
MYSFTFGYASGYIVKLRPRQEVSRMVGMIALKIFPFAHYLPFQLLWPKLTSQKFLSLAKVITNSIPVRRKAF